MLDDTVSLHSTPINHERRRSPVLVLIWVSIVVSHLTLGGLVWFAISYSGESGYQNRSIEDLTTETDTLRREVEVWRIYIEDLRKGMMNRGIEVPPLPDLNVIREKKEK